MRAINFEGANTNLTKPGDMTDDQCGSLYAAFDPQGYQSFPTFRSAWKLTAEEIEALKNGAHVVLTVISSMHPPVSLHVQTMVEKVAAEPEVKP